MLIARTLGSVEITLDEQTLRFKMSKAVVLLIYLMRHADREHGREQLATLLWPEEPDRKSRENFRQALYQIRRALGDHATTYLRVDQTSVQFLPDAPHTLDANQFEQAVEARAWREAANLYLGEFLSTFYAEDAPELGEWQLMTREHLHQLAVQTFIHLARQNEISDPLGASQYARRLLELEPWSETGHRSLMRCWARLGNMPEALAQYEKCAALLQEQLGVPPTPQTVALYEQMRNGQWVATPLPAKPTSPPPAVNLGQLPANLTPTIGREQDLADLRELLAQPECRLLTLVGVGGIGKTKLLLALGWACHHAQTYADGVQFASLAELEPTTSEPVGAQIAHHLVQLLLTAREETNAATALALLVEAWHGREQLLLLDNWEHLLDGAALLSELLTHLPQLTIVTTSRVPLNLHGEWLYSLHGLSLTEEKGAVQLFAQAARRVQPQFKLDDEQVATAVVAICQALEGHPLALEMAAASLRGLTLSELLAEVTAGLDVLTTNQANIPHRQRDMRDLLAASWERLSPTEQTILSQLALFRQPFSTEAAVAMTAARIGQMAAIVAQAWLRRTADGRYQTHELLRHFAREQLAQNRSLEETARQKYVQYHLQWLASWAHEPLTPSKVTMLMGSWADINLAWVMGIQQGEWLALKEAIPTLSAYYMSKGLLGEGIVWLAEGVKQVTTAVDSTTPAAQRVHAQLLITQADLRNIQVQSAPVPDLMAEAIAIAETVADDNLLFSAKIALAHGLARLGQLTESIEIGLALLPPNNPAPSLLQQADLWSMIGITYGELGEWPLSNKYLRQAVAYYEEQGVVMQAAVVRHNLALTLLQQGEFGAARRLFVQNAQFLRQHPSLSLQASTYEGLGVVWLRLERLALAERYLRRAKGMYEQLGDKDGLAYVAFYQGRVALARESWEQAGKLFLKSAELRQAMNMSYVLAQPWGGVALAAWRGGNTAVAHTYFDKLLPAFLAGDIVGEDIAWLYDVVTQLAQEMAHPQTEAIQQAAQQALAVT